MNRIKNILVTFLLLIIVILNIQIMLNKNDKKSKNKKLNLDLAQYYNQKFVEMEIENKNKRVKLPNNKNILLIGLNSNFDGLIERIDKFYKTINFKKYNLEMIVVTKNDIIDKKFNLKIFNYKSKKFNENFGLNDNDNFTILINNLNIVEFFTNYFLSARDNMFLIYRFRKEVLDNES